MSSIEAIAKSANTYVDIRRRLHAHPELSYEEHQTAALVIESLQVSGVEVHTGIGKTGVVGVIRGTQGNTSRAIGLRADMDALPVQENNHFAHKSKIAGKMHACGHDGHTAMLLAAANYLAKHRDFAGTVYCIFQPAEEGGAGAKAMIDDGLFQRFPMEAVFGLHNWPGLAAGSFALSPGPVMASSSEFCLMLTGKGAHAAMPHWGRDCIPVACQIVQAWQTIVSRQVAPIDPAVLSVTRIHAGHASNVIPETCEVSGTVRTFTEEVLDLIETEMCRLANGIADAFGMQTEFTFERNYPPVINHAKPTEHVRQVLTNWLSESQIHTQIPTMGAEDFAFMLREKPGCYAFIGNDGNGSSTTEDNPCMLHNPNYDFNDEILPLGASYWVKLVQSFFA